jgi:hypothetical protein
MADLFRLSASEAAARIREGNLTSEALVRSCLERIDARESQVKAWVYLDPILPWRKRGNATEVRAAVQFMEFRSLPRTLWTRLICPPNTALPFTKATVPRRTPRVWR